MSHRSHGRKARRSRWKSGGTPVFTSTERIAVPWSVDEPDSLMPETVALITAAAEEFPRRERIDAAPGGMIGTVNDNTAPITPTADVLALAESVPVDQVFTLDWLCSKLPRYERHSVSKAISLLVKAPHRPYIRIDSATSGRYTRVDAKGAALTKLKREQPRRGPNTPRTSGGQVAGATTSARSTQPRRRTADPTYTVVTVGDCSDDTRCVIMRDEDGNLWDCLLVPVKPGVSFS